MIPKPDIERLNTLFEKFDKLTWPDINLVEEIMTMLGIHEIVELENVLNSKDVRERQAAIKMVKRYLQGLISGDIEQYTESKETLKEIYYQIHEIDILES